MSVEHPIFLKPGPAEVGALTRARPELSEREAFGLLMRQREERIEKAESDPLRFGWEPGVWRVARSLMGLDWAIPKAYGGADYARKVRMLYGFDEPVDCLCVLGGNRSAKSTFECKVSMESLMEFDDAVVWLFHTDGDMSRTIHQRYMFEFLPPELRDKALKSREGYISYSRKTGFSAGTGFILPNLSEAEFRNYNQSEDKIEGGELGAKDRGRCVGFVADELVPARWIKTLMLRLATREACGLLGFTPVRGFSDTVGMFVTGATVCDWSPAWLLPTDGGGPDEERALQREEMDLRVGQWVDGEFRLYADEMIQLRRKKLAAMECQFTKQRKSFSTPEGRRFELVPRVMRSADSGLGVMCFHSPDNPFGNPGSVLRRVRNKSRSFILERFYGLAEQTTENAFPKYKESVHEIAPEQVPDGGTDYMYCDPAGDRPFFMLWIREMEDGRTFVVNEWPNQVDDVPGEGVLGPWAEPSESVKWRDGRKGDGQVNLGWGLLEYKREIARMEGWEEYRPDDEIEEVSDWDEECEKRVPVVSRVLDAAFANATSTQAAGQVSLFDEFDEVGLTFEESVRGSRNSVDDGKVLINDALAYNEDRPLGLLNRPRLQISSRCKNLIFALKVWTGLDGQKGATKDPIDCLRMHFLKGNRHEEPDGAGCVEGRSSY